VLSAGAAWHGTVEGPDVLQNEHDFSGPCEPELSPRLGLDGGGVFVEPALFLAEPSVLLLQGGQPPGLGPGFTPRPGRHEKPLLANERVRRQDHCHEQERRIQEPAPGR
jgi:hypothetical protein